MLRVLFTNSDQLKQIIVEIDPVVVVFTQTHLT